MVVNGSSPEVRQMRSEADHSPQSSDEIKMMGVLPQIPNMPSWLGA
jgi:hypothetical protein